jgi:hypothetical protein
MINPYKKILVQRRKVESDYFQAMSRSNMKEGNHKVAAIPNCIRASHGIFAFLCIFRRRRYRKITPVGIILEGSMAKDLRSKNVRKEG